MTRNDTRWANRQRLRGRLRPVQLDEMDVAAEGRKGQIRQRENEDEGSVKKIQN